MESVLLALIQQLNTSVFTLVAILGVAFWALFKLGGIVKSYKDYEGDKTRIESKMDGMKDSLYSIKATTDLLYQAHLTTIKAASPVKLTELGEAISKELSIPLKVDGHWGKISAEVSKKNPQNPYDIQTTALAIARNCFDVIFDETERNEVKTLAFNRGMNLLEIYPIIGIEIRNRVMKEKGLPLEEIDKHDPAKKH